MKNFDKPLDFSFSGYRGLLSPFIERIVDYPEATNANSFVVLRHDVEFSISRAYEIAKIDSEMGIVSTFLFQVCSDAYNLSSDHAREVVSEIASLGMKVGLHFYVSNIPVGDKDKLFLELSRQRNIFEASTGMDCDRFSFHRPPRWVLLHRADYMAGLLNLYGESFFEFSQSPTKIKYIADSLHRFKYGHPHDFIDKHKIQILLHPDEWSSENTNEEENFRMLEIEHHKFFEETLAKESPANYQRRQAK